MNTPKKMMIYFLYLIGGIIVFVMGYFGCAWLFARITVNANPEPGQTVTAYILTNGAHTDFVLPVKSDEINWTEWFPYEHTKGNDSTQMYIGIGWGDKGFYLNTPTWNDLTLTTAFNAVTGLGGTAVHATYHAAIHSSEKSFALHLSSSQYRQLIAYIKQSLKMAADGKPVLIQTSNQYGMSDAFYEANGRYSMFFTCNTWTNQGLKSCGQKACLWTPFQSGIFLQYK